MWKSVVGHDVNVKVETEADDWETDPNFENDVSEQEQRWGAKTIEGSGRKEHISIADLRNKVSHEHEVVKKKEMENNPKASYGYGGKFGVEKDRMDKGALGHDYVAKVDQHSSQTDAAKGFGGKYGVQKDRIDKSAMNYEYKGEVQQHASQKDYAKGFGGKYGVQKERVDKAAMGYDYKGETEKHQSQKDYAKGFGGKYGVEKEKVDKAALGYDYKSETEKHQSQKDYAKGFGGRYGVEADRMDKSAASFNDMESPSSSYEKPKAYEASSVGAGNLKARFENMAKASDDENKKRAEEERTRRLAREKREQEESRHRQQEQSRQEEVEESKKPPPVPAPQKFKKLPEIPRDEPKPQEQGRYEEEEESKKPPPVPAPQKFKKLPEIPRDEPKPQSRADMKKRRRAGNLLRCRLHRHSENCQRFPEMNLSQNHRWRNHLTMRNHRLCHHARLTCMRKTRRKQILMKQNLMKLLHFHHRMKIMRILDHTFPQLLIMTMKILALDRQPQPFMITRERPATNCPSCRMISSLTLRWWMSIGGKGLVVGTLACFLLPLCSLIVRHFPKQGLLT